ncbi:hypothetical protein V501_09972 [Pseudogymnoascus sp. VKM F-4519 (FW-2642)]|nr:hypothetical protein V501_09972 [Pseudogymnoascus sp. VKM F-4519 (FW-2642)]
MSRKLDTPERTPLSRNVYIYDNDGHILGGVYQNGSLTNLNLYEMCDIIIIASEPFSLFRLNKDGSTGAKVAKNRENLLAGSYIVLTNDGEPNSVRITNERTLRRIITKIPSSKLTPTDGYKIIYLSKDVLNLDGRTIDLSCRDPQSPDRVPDELFHWQFRQAILAIVRGNGQRIWNMQLEEEDPMGDIMEGPDAAERMEAELFTRLGAGEIDYSAAPEMHSPSFTILYYKNS